MRLSTIWPAFALATLAFYAAPLFSSRASIHWDLADVSYPAQKYFAESIHTGKLPQWTPYLDSGIPFLSDPRTGAWYPLHWPFFAIGITPRTMVWELALHAFLAMAGAFLLARRLLVESCTPGSAVLAALLYGWGGFFAAHSSTLPLFETASLLPWLLWAGLNALDSGKLRWMAVTGMVGGFIVLAGDLPAELSCLVALICISAAFRAPWKRTVTVIASAVICAFLLSAIQMLPALELARYAHQNSMGAPLRFKTLATFIAADYYGVISGLYSGPDDIRQHYLYSGILLVPLALAGIISGLMNGAVRREKILPIAALILPALIYAFTPGPRGSASMDSWFVAALGLSMAAACGVVWAVQLAVRPRLGIALVVISAIDLWYWNMYKNPLVYARTSFSELYGKSLPSSQPLGRIWSPYVPLSMGPADGSLLSRTEVTWGSGLGGLDRYRDYLHAAESNAKLLNGLGVSQVLNPGGKLQGNPLTLGRASIPPQVQFVADRSAALSALATLDPAQSAVVEAVPRAISPGLSSLAILDGQDDFYRIRVEASGDSLLRIAVPYYPGWSASVDGTSVNLMPVDEALTGVFVPAGRHEITLQYRSARFREGALLSGVGVIVIVLGLALPL